MTKLDGVVRSVVRSVVRMGETVRRLEAKGVHLRIVAMGVDTRTPAGELMLNVLASVAPFEREVMLERQREGVAKAKNERKSEGRERTARVRSASGGRSRVSAGLHRAQRTGSGAHPPAMRVLVQGAAG